MASWQSKAVYTPPMYASYPMLTEPRGGKGERDCPDNQKQWRLNVIGDQGDDQVQAFFSQIKGFMKEAHGPDVGPGKNAKPKIGKFGMPMRPEMKENDDGEEVPTGRFTMKVKRNFINGATGNEQGGPMIVDSQGNPWNKKVLIGNNSVVRVKLHFWAWDRTKEREGVGLTAELHAVQVVELVEFEGGAVPVTADGFGVVEGGAISPQTQDDDFQNLPQDDFSKQLRQAAEETEAASAGYTDDEPF
jgi:hypothetical protein